MSTRQRPVVTLPGRIFDIDAARALVYEDSAAPFVLRLVDRATNASEAIWSETLDEPRVSGGWLIPGGAIFAYARSGDGHLLRSLPGDRCVNVVFTRTESVMLPQESSIVLRLGDGTEVVLATFPTR